MREMPIVLLVSALCIAAPAASRAAFGGEERPQPGDVASSFTAPLLAGGDLALGQHLGKEAILLDFWSIYCVACMEEMPKIVDLYQRYRESGLVVVGVNLDSFGTKRVVRFVEGLEYDIPFPLVIDKRREVAGAYAVSVLPTTVLIDRQGKVSYYHVGYAPGDEAELEEKVKLALGEGL